MGKGSETAGFSRLHACFSATQTASWRRSKWLASPVVSLGALVVADFVTGGA